MSSDWDIHFAGQVMQTLAKKKKNFNSSLETFKKIFLFILIGG